MTYYVIKVNNREELEFHTLEDTIVGLVEEARQLKMTEELEKVCFQKIENIDGDDMVTENVDIYL